MAIRAATEYQSPAGRQSPALPVYEVSLPQTSASDSGSVIADMVDILSANERGSTAESLAFLRQLYPGYPLTLRLAAIVAYSKSQSSDF